jgi:polyhydroxyalkanoate synthesis repressor PhaR
MPIVIKRYQNRKLYNTQSKRYITLEEIEDLIKHEQEVTVVDNNTGKDITAITLSQIIFELEKNRAEFLPIKLLSSLVQSGGSKIEIIRRNIINSLNIYHQYDAEIEKRVNLLIEQGEITLEEGTKLLEKLLSIGLQTHDTVGNFSDELYSYMKEHQIPTKNDLNLLIQKIDSISQRVDELFQENNNKK